MMELVINKGPAGESVYLNDYRISGNKPCGGKIIKSYNVKEKDVLNAIGKKDSKELESQLSTLQEQYSRAVEQLKEGRDYLMQCGHGCNDSDALEAFGFGRDGMRQFLKGAKDES